MLDLSWYWGTAVSLVILAVSLLPDRFKLRIAAIALVAAIVFAFMGYAHRNSAIQEPSVGIDNIGLDVYSDKVCLNTILRNSGRDVAYITEYGDVKIKGTQGTAAPPVQVTIAANGGTMPFASRVIGKAAVDLVKAKVSTTGVLKFYYHGDSGSEHSLCVNGYWDHDMSRFWVGGPIGACSVKPNTLRHSRDWLTLFLVIYGIFVLGWYITFCLIGVSWRPAFWRHICLNVAPCAQK